VTLLISDRNIAEMGGGPDERIHLEIDTLVFQAMPFSGDLAVIMTWQEWAC